MTAHSPPVLQALALALPQPAPPLLLPHPLGALAVWPAPTLPLPAPRPELYLPLPATPMEVATTMGVLAAEAPARMLAARAANALSLPEILEKDLGAFSSSSAEATGRHDQKWLLL